MLKIAYIPNGYLLCHIIKGRALTQMYTVAPITKRANLLLLFRNK